MQKLILVVIIMVGKNISASMMGSTLFCMNRVVIALEEQPGHVILESRKADLCLQNHVKGDNMISYEPLLRTMRQKGITGYQLQKLGLSASAYYCIKAGKRFSRPRLKITVLVLCPSMLSFHTFICRRRILPEICINHLPRCIPCNT